MAWGGLAVRRALCLLAAVGALFLAAPRAGLAEDRELVSLLAELGATCEWNPLRGSGVIAIGEDRIAFQLDTPFVLVNWRERVRIEAPRRRDGAVWFSEAATAAVKAEVERQRAERAAQGLRIATIILDPGHGGTEPGSVGELAAEGKKTQLLEKDVVLKIATDLGALLAAGLPDKEVRFIRADDTTVKLEERPRIANRILDQVSGSVLYVSIHANASFNRKATGFEAWVLPGSYRRNVLEPSTASAEDAEVLPILNSMMEEEISVESVILARDILAGLSQTIGKESPYRGLKEMDWAVVRNSRMPAVLVEVGYVTNPGEAAKLTDDAYLRRIAEGLYTGIRTFVARYERERSGGAP